MIMLYTILWINNKVVKLYPKKEVKVKTFQVKEGYAIVVNDILRVEVLDTKNSLSFYMNDRLRYEKVKSSNSKLVILPNKSINVDGQTDIVINGLGFVKVNRPGLIKLYVLDTKLISTRKKLI